MLKKWGQAFHVGLKLPACPFLERRRILSVYYPSYHLNFDLVPLGVNQPSLRDSLDFIVFFKVIDGCFTLGGLR